MKCAKCGAELKVGCIYCSVCGQEAQIVPDYNLLEDDFLKELLNEEKREGTSKKGTQSQKGGQSQRGGQSQKGESQKGEQPKKGEQKKSSKKKKKSKTPVIVGSIGAVVLLVVLICLLVSHNHNNSYDYQMEKAEDCVKDNEYAKAQNYLERAVELQNDSTEALMLLADVYLEQKQRDDAIDTLKKVIEIENVNEEAYRKLIEIYAELEDYDAIAKLSAQVEDSAIMDLFSDYLVTAPVIKESRYDEEKGLHISAQSGTTTYYTLDGSDPKKGEEYEEAIFLEEGTTTIRMISVNDLGIYSEETECSFKVEFKPPEAPKVTPDGGSFHTPETITIEVPDGCRAYFTWDGSDPTANSKQYTAPLEMPEGNNILSVILVDEKDLWSDVTKCNFIYLP